MILTRLMTLKTLTKSMNMMNVANVEDIDDIDKIVGTENIVMNTMQLMSNSLMKSSIAITAVPNLAIF